MTSVDIWREKEEEKKVMEKEESKEEGEGKGGREWESTQEGRERGGRNARGKGEQESGGEVDECLQTVLYSNNFLEILQHTRYTHTSIRYVVRSRSQTQPGNETNLGTRLDSELL